MPCLHPHIFWVVGFAKPYPLDGWLGHMHIQCLCCFELHTWLCVLTCFRSYCTFVCVIREMFDYDKMLQLIVAGFFVCLDSFLSLLTIMPARIVVTIWRVLKTRWVCSCTVNSMKYIIVFWLFIAWNKFGVNWCLASYWH